MSKASRNEQQEQPVPQADRTCGIVMPISGIDGYPQGHWVDVRKILEETIREAGFEPNLVSETNEVALIHKTIVENLYKNPIVVCDISGRNPNVMFELGVRLTFDKATVITKDDKTAYPFDTSAIEYIEYPSDLRFGRIVEFQSKLAAKIAATYKKAITDKDYSPFLKHFGEFTVPKISEKEVPVQEYILSELRLIREELRRTDRAAVSHSWGVGPADWKAHDVRFKVPSMSEYERIAPAIREIPRVLINVRELAEGVLVSVITDSDENWARLKNTLAAFRVGYEATGAFQDPIRSPQEF